jgi:hypothetical protein
MENNVGFVVHCICGSRTVFKSRWSSRASTAHIERGVRFHHETFWNNEGFTQSLFEVTSRRDLDTKTIIHVKRINNK